METDRRFRCGLLRDRIMSADEAALLIREGMTVAVSGFTPSGCPKMVPQAVSEQVRSGKRKLRLTLFSGASTGEELDSDWAELGIIARRLPYMTSRALRAAVNGRPYTTRDARQAKAGFFQVGRPRSFDSSRISLL